MLKIAAGVHPGYQNASAFANTNGQTFPAQLSSYGFNMGMLESYWFQTNLTSTTFSTTVGTGQVADADLVTMAGLYHMAGMKVGLKPQIVATTGGQNNLLPGGIVITDAVYTSGGTTLTSATGGFTSAINSWGPSSGAARAFSWHSGDVPGSTNSTYGNTPSTNSVVSPSYTGASWTYVNSTTLTLSTPFTATRTGAGGPPILVVNESGLTTWFSAYQTLLDHLLSLATFDFLELDTEHTFLHTVAPANYRSLIAHLISNNPSLPMTIAMQIAGNDYYDISFWDALPVGSPMAVDWYKQVQTSAYDSLSTVKGNWSSYSGATYLANLAAFSAAWGREVMFGEIGYRSIEGAGIAPGTSSGGTVSNVDQATCVQAFYDQVWNQPWFAGFVWWVWNYPDTTVDETHTYSPYQKPAGNIHGAYLGGSSWQHRSFTSSGSRYRSNPS